MVQKYIGVLTTRVNVQKKGAQFNLHSFYVRAGRYWIKFITFPQAF